MVALNSLNLYAIPSEENGPSRLASGAVGQTLRIASTCRRNRKPIDGRCMCSHVIIQRSTHWWEIPYANRIVYALETMKNEIEITLLNWCARNNARHLNSATSLCRRVETKQLKKRNWHKNQFDCARTHNARAWFNLIFIENFTDLHNESPQHTQSLTTVVANYNNETGANQMLSRMRALHTELTVSRRRFAFNGKNHANAIPPVQTSKSSENLVATTWRIKLRCARSLASQTNVRLTVMHAELLSMIKRVYEMYCILSHKIASAISLLMSWPHADLMATRKTDTFFILAVLQKLDRHRPVRSCVYVHTR